LNSRWSNCGAVERTTFLSTAQSSQAEERITSTHRLAIHHAGVTSSWVKRIAAAGGSPSISKSWLPCRLEKA
jgi:hypothetical protein